MPLTLSNSCQNTEKSFFLSLDCFLITTVFYSCTSAERSKNAHVMSLQLFNPLDFQRNRGSLCPAADGMSPQLWSILSPSQAVSVEQQLGQSLWTQSSRFSSSTCLLHPLHSCPMPRAGAEGSSLHPKKQLSLKTRMPDGRDRGWCTDSGFNHILALPALTAEIHGHVFKTGTVGAVWHYLQTQHCSYRWYFPQLRIQIYPDPWTHRSTNLCDINISALKKRITFQQTYFCVWKIKAVSQNFSHDHLGPIGQTQKEKKKRNAARTKSSFTFKIMKEFLFCSNWSKLKTKRTIIWTLIWVVTPAITINLKSGLTLLQSPAGTWYLQTCNVLSQLTLLGKSLAQKNSQLEGWSAFHPLPCPRNPSGSSERI